MEQSATALQGMHLTDKKIHELIGRAQEWALLHGVVLKPADKIESTTVVEHAPMTLFPSLMPRRVLQEAKSLQIHFNRLMHKVAHDDEFLEKTLKNVIKVDNYTGMLWNIYSTVRDEGLSQPLSLGVFRNDYMLDVKGGCEINDSIKPTPALKQIEFNTIASGLGGVVSGISNVHRYTMTLAGVDFKDDQIPDTSPVTVLAQGLLKAWEVYNKSSAIIVFVVQELERNRMDQKWLEKRLFELNRSVRVRYVYLTQVAEKGKVMEDKTYLIDNDEVAVFYFRTGYSPANYTSKKIITARLDMERSTAIKCPSVHYQLAGCKKIQQALAAPGAVERFIKDQSVATRIRSTFAGLHSLDWGSEGDAAIAMAMKSPGKFVVKPQREGGGNNLYGDDMKDHLEKIKDSDERSSYILMERIFPWPQKNHLLKVGQDPRLRGVISELGIFGVYLGTKDEEIFNLEAGHLLRTKPKEDNEGGFLTGFATVDNPFLID